MISLLSRLSPEVRSLLDRERAIEVLPAAARTRALARARAALAAGVARRPLPSLAPSTVSWAAVAAGLAFLATVTAAAAAYELGIRARPVAPVILPIAPSPSVEPKLSHPAEMEWPDINLPDAPRRIARSAISRDRFAREELHLIEQARAAVAREDFAAAEQLLAEDAHRFRTGRLAEEREALSVRALAGLGRRGDARRVAADFEARFPRSPLLSTVRHLADSVP
jgi:hypothetical protein